MKLKTLFPAVALVSWICTGTESRADITLNYDFTSGAAVPDGFGQLSEVKTLGGLSGMKDINNAVTRLNLTSTSGNDPMFLGDVYSSMTFGTSTETQRIAVLLNRPGRDDTNPFGSGLSSLNVTLDDSSAATNVWAATSGTGTYNSDGRLAVNPNAAGVAFASGSNSLTALDGATLASNRVSLLVADFSQGGAATLSGWGVSVTGAAATSGTFTPGANASISDAGSGATTVGAILNTTGASGGSLTVHLTGTMTFSNGVTGSAGLNKTGAGALVLEGASNYNGTTAVNAGKLVVNGDLSAATGNVTVSGAGTRLIGTGTIGGDTTINIGAIHSAGGSVANVDKIGVQTFDETGAGTTNLTYAAGSIFEWDINGNTNVQGSGTEGSPYIFDQVLGNGTLAIDSADLTGAIFRVVLGSSVGVDAGTFWQQTQTWSNIFGVGLTLAGSGFNNSLLQVVDSAGATYDPGTLNAGYGFTVSGTSLTWSAVPEPTSALIGFLVTAGLLRRRRVG